MIWKLNIESNGTLTQVGRFSDEERALFSDADLIAKAHELNNRVDASIRTLEWIADVKDADGNILEKSATLVAAAQNKGCGFLAVINGVLCAVNC